MSMGPGSQEFQYKAFISYRWRPTDRNAARWIQERLESYRLPKSPLSSKVKRTRLGKIFRDDTDLRASPDLPKEIETRLANSEWLIVVCSTDTPESAWVDKELAHFIHVRGRDHVIAALVNGDRHQSLPKRLSDPPGLWPPTCVYQLCVLGRLRDGMG